VAGYGETGNPDNVPEATLDAWQREGIIDYLGQRDDMPQVYAQAQVVCLPSWREGVPLALIEGAACGRPLVASDVPGCREVVRHEETGLLAPPRDAASLAAALRRLLLEKATRQRMGAAGRELAQREFSLERVISETLALYERVLNRKRLSR
ncbi:MAG: glycosyltransferase, partial [Anaerolineaceae bacterium]|nr:glycosyltransferase [Anaerolineaceae bacterium]